MLKDSKDPADFCIIGQDSEARLSNFERLTLTGGQDLEKALTWASRQLENFDFSHKLGVFEAKHFFKAAEYYTKQQDFNETWLAHPANYYLQPVLPDRSGIIERVFHGLPDGQILDVTLPSAYQPWVPEYRSEYLACQENLTIHARIWQHHPKHSSNPPPTLIAIHGWSMGDQRINSLAFLPGLFYQLGFNVVLVELPYHGRRKPKSSNSPTEYMFPSLNLVRTNEAIAQAISDLRTLKVYLQSKELQAIGCMGMSLGSYIGALWASLDKLDFCVPIVPMVSMSELAWEIITRDPSFADLQQSGVTLELLEAVFKMHCPLSFTPATPKTRSIIIAGIGDKIVPPRQPQLLWEHWQRPRILWFQGGHVAQIKRSRAFKEVVAFFLDLKLIESVPEWSALS